MNYIFIDFEMQAISKEYKNLRKICTSEIIEIGAVMLNDSYEEISSFKAYVKPSFSKHISKNIIELTGITYNYLFGMKRIDVELNSFADWCLSMGEDIKVYAWSESDLSQLLGEVELKKLECSDNLKKVISCWNDLQMEYDALVGSNRATSLTRALESVGIYFEGHMHDALDDSRNTASLFREMIDEEEFHKSIEYIRSFYSEEKKSSGVTLGDLIDFSQFGFIA